MNLTFRANGGISNVKIIESRLTIGMMRKNEL